MLSSPLDNHIPLGCVLLAFSHRLAKDLHTQPIFLGITMLPSHLVYYIGTSFDGRNDARRRQRRSHCGAFGHCARVFCACALSERPSLSLAALPYSKHTRILITAIHYPFTNLLYFSRPSARGRCSARRTSWTARRTCTSRGTRSCGRSCRSGCCSRARSS